MHDLVIGLFINRYEFGNTFAKDGDEAGRLSPV